MPGDSLGKHRRFSLIVIEGGLTRRLGMRFGLKRPASLNVTRRALLSTLVTWVPLLLLSAMQGNAVGSKVAIPFLRDYAIHARFLLAVPMLILAEEILSPRIEAAAHHFIESGLVVDGDLRRFEAAVDKGLRWSESASANLVLIVLTYVVTAMTFSSTASHASTWYQARQGSVASLTIPGWWLALFCIPFLHFLTLRWFWRLFLWGQFLWRMSRINLQLVAIHPDRAGGLAFVGEAAQFFGVVLFALSATLSGVLANEIIYDRLPLKQFMPVIAVYLVVVVVIVLSPLFVFLKVLFKVKTMGLHQYGTFATEYAVSFQGKWIDKPRQTGEAILGSGDIQSLADLGNSYSFVKSMGILPLEKRTPAILALACLVPMAPLLLTVMPLGQLLKMVLKVLM